MIQMGAFLSEDLAETQAAKASLLGVPSRVVKTTNSMVRESAWCVAVSVLNRCKPKKWLIN